MEKKKVLFLSAANSIHTVRWVNAISETMEVHLVFCSDHKPNVDMINSKVILHQLKYKSPLGYYLNFLQLKKIYKKILPDIINVHYASGYGTLARIANLKNILLSVWGSDVYDFPNESKIKKRILQKNVMNARCIASTSNVMAEELKRQVPMLNQEIYITPFGVDIEKFKKKETLKDEKEFKIGNIKTLKNSIYGIDIGILAFKKLKENLTQNNEQELSNKLKLYIYGDGEDKEELENLIISNNLGKEVFLMGKVANEQVPNILNGLDVFCITSNKESFGVSIVEAMACQVPVVATDADGFCEVMENNKTGYIVERRNVDAIAEALEKLLKNKILREEFGQNGRTRVVEKFDWKKNVEKMCSIYNKLIEDNIHKTKG